MSAAFTPGPTFADTGDFANDGKWLDGADAVDLGAPEYGERFHGAAGVDGQVRKGFGYRGRRISLKVVYVAASADAAVAAFQTDMGNMANTALQLVYNGQTFYGCFLDPRSTRATGLTATGLTGGKYLYRAQSTVNAMRLA